MLGKAYDQQSLPTPAKAASRSCDRTARRRGRDSGRFVAIYATTTPKYGRTTQAARPPSTPIRTLCRLTGGLHRPQLPEIVKIVAGRDPPLGVPPSQRDQ